eukprot:gnl/Hemi2/13639_TR4643_c0_g1_i1.p1 gnl/Hemi2/13639_TR4643_c0_g1~~gnl/Hemi2/13639_TR4643_c0_g1_i1.p1  ORF type:complete len:401 (-),score=87.95 gnl/Hemi2/13639_TR4643_c0_g1_i1:118-1320(-)
MAEAPRRKVAFVVGNGNYPGCPLASCVNDAVDVADRLTRQGFATPPYDKVVAYTDLSKQEMQRLLDEFVARLRRRDDVVFFFSGHGVEENNILIVLPADCENSVRDGLSLNTLEKKLNRIHDTRNVIILDCCRSSKNSPWKRFATETRFKNVTRIGRRPDATAEFLVAFACDPGAEARAGSDRRNSPYTEKFLEYMTSCRSVLEMFGRVGVAVKAMTGGQQQPWIHVTGGVYGFSFTDDNLEWEPMDEQISYDVLHEDQPVFKDWGDYADHEHYPEEATSAEYYVDSAPDGEECYCYQDAATDQNSAEYYADDDAPDGDECGDFAVEGDCYDGSETLPTARPAPPSGNVVQRYRQALTREVSRPVHYKRASALHSPAPPAPAAPHRPLVVYHGNHAGWKK